MMLYGSTQCCLWNPAQMDGVDLQLLNPDRTGRIDRSVLLQQYDRAINKAYMQVLVLWQVPD